MLTSKQRAQLRSIANSDEVIIYIGKGGLNEAIYKQADDALEKRELIKGGLLESAPVSVREAADSVAAAVGADVVQVIGRKFVLYRESKENKHIKLVK
jgi:RNA-binding protein